MFQNRTFNDFRFLEKIPSNNTLYYPIVYGLYGIIWVSYGVSEHMLANNLNLTSSCHVLTFSNPMIQIIHTSDVLILF